MPSCFSARLQQDVNHVKAELSAQFKLHHESLRPRPSDKFPGRCPTVLPPEVSYLAQRGEGRRRLKRRSPPSHLICTGRWQRSYLAVVCGAAQQKYSNRNRLNQSGPHLLEERLVSKPSIRPIRSWSLRDSHAVLFMRLHQREGR